MNITEIEDQAESVGVVIRAAEDWSKEYRKDASIHAKLIRVEARLERVLRRYFIDYSERAPNYIDWFKYAEALQKVNAAEFMIDVLIEDGPIGLEDKFLIQVLYEPIAEGTQLGFDFGESITSRTLGLSRTSDLVQKTAMQSIAELVGMKLDPSGVLVRNKNSNYSITETIRKDIRRSIATSINLSEDQKAATKRLQKVIKNPKRAAVIARTEAVNSFQGGLLSMGQTSGAVGKKWQSVNFSDICGDNDRIGPIPINAKFPSGHLSPVAHPNCRCGMRLIYPEDPASKKL